MDTLHQSCCGWTWVGPTGFRTQTCYPGLDGDGEVKVRGNRVSTPGGTVRVVRPRPSPPPVVTSQRPSRDVWFSPTTLEKGLFFPPRVRTPFPNLYVSTPCMLTFICARKITLLVLSLLVPLLENRTHRRVSNFVLR